MVRRVGKYEIRHALGKGVYCEVRYGVNKETGEACALKIIAKKQDIDPDVFDKLRREVAILRQLKHPHIVRLLDVLQSDRNFYLVFELAEGGELLDHIIKHGRLSEADCRNFFQQIILGLFYIHHMGIAHRDMKPENILLTSDGRLVISDFGFSKGAISTMHTICGTPYYVAPEVLTGAYDGFEADTWSSGVVLYAMASGQLPFLGKNHGELFKKIRAGGYAMPECFSPDLKDLISNLLQVDPKTRYTLEDIMMHPWFTEGTDEQFWAQFDEIRVLEPLDISTIQPVAVESAVDTNAFSPGDAPERPPTTPTRRSSWAGPSTSPKERQEDVVGSPSGSKASPVHGARRPSADAASHAAAASNAALAQDAARQAKLYPQHQCDSSDTPNTESTPTYSTTTPPPKHASGKPPPSLSPSSAAQAAASKAVPKPPVYVRRGTWSGSESRDHKDARSSDAPSTPPPGTTRRSTVDGTASPPITTLAATLHANNTAGLPPLSANVPACAPPRGPAARRTGSGTGTTPSAQAKSEAVAEDEDRVPRLETRRGTLT